LYNLFWSSSSRHCGFWEKNTRSWYEAVRNTDILASKLLDLNKKDYVLDAGCGVGGTAFFMAKNFGARVLGITLSSRQLKQAKRNAKKLRLDDRVSFEKLGFDGMRRRFRKETFTKIFGIESICYSQDKLCFLKEAYRILKPGGKILVEDAFLSKKRLTPKERQIYEKCMIGWNVPDVSHRDDFSSYLKKAGFKNIKFYDKTTQVLPSSRIIALGGYLLFPLTFVLSKMGFISDILHENSVGMINQGKACNKFVVYGVFVAEK